MNKFHTLAAVFAFAAMFVLGGCGTSRARVEQPLVERMPENADDLDFWHALSEETITCNSDATYGLLLFLENLEGTVTYEDRLARMKELSMLPEGFDEPGEEAVSRGMVAYALARALETEGGVVMRAFGNTNRYALRELQFTGVFPPSSTNQALSGPEFLDVIGRADDQFVRAEIKAPAVPSARKENPAGEAKYAGEPDARPASNDSDQGG